MVIFNSYVGLREGIDIVSPTHFYTLTWPNYWERLGNISIIAWSILDIGNTLEPVLGVGCKIHIEKKEGFENKGSL